MEALKKTLRNMPKEWGRVALEGRRTRSRSGSRSPRGAAAAPARAAGKLPKHVTDKQRLWARMNATFAKPHKGDVIFDPDDPENAEKHLIYDGHDWIQAVDPFGDYGGPYASMRELLGNPKYREEMRELAALEAEAAGKSLVDKVFAEYLAKVPADRRAAAEAEGKLKYKEALEAAASHNAAILSDETQLGAKARRALKGYLPAEAAPAARQKKKGGGRRTRKARKGSRKGRKGTRRH